MKINQIKKAACIAILLLAACNNPKVKIFDQNEFPAPPVADKIPVVFNEFGRERVDNYFWIRDKEDPKVLEYLNAEMRYTDIVMGPTKALQEKIYDEILGRIKETDETFPLYRNGYYYYSRTESGKQYRIYCRKKDSPDSPEEIIFDVNKMAEGKRAFSFMSYSVSPDNSMIAYSFNETGSSAEATLKVKNMETGEDLDLSIDKVSTFAWANDNKTIFYTVIDAALRPYRLYSHTIGAKKPTRLVFEESDGRFNIWVTKSKTNDFILCQSSSRSTSEVRLLSADNPAGNFSAFMPREQGTDYSVMHHKEYFYIKYKDSANINSMIYKAPLDSPGDRSTWSVFMEHNPQVRIESVDLVKDFIAVEVKENGLNSIKIFNLENNTQDIIEFPEPVYSVWLNGNPEYDATTIRYNYTSLNRPNTLFEYDMVNRKSIKLKEQEIPSGFNPRDYTVERLWATAPDGVKVPMAIVYKKGLRKNGKNPALLYSYGSYGFSSDVFFSPAVYSLIDRGFVYAIAQIRGGSDLGEQWYEDGKLLNKKNTFTDFIACAERLIELKYTSASKLAAMGGSAGGLLMGAVANMRPQLFNTIVAQVPFVDVINTMLDTSLPLTTQEYEEWGNPAIEEYYNYILSYSPYDNITEQYYPNILATGGLNDSQVGFHEPAKWVAKLRERKKDSNIVLLYMNMESGHGGATGRYDRIKETAFEWAFILNRSGICK